MLCRFWQELGYLIIYITGRPDIQQVFVYKIAQIHSYYFVTTLCEDSNAFCNGSASTTFHMVLPIL